MVDLAVFRSWAAWTVSFALAGTFAASDLLAGPGVNTHADYSSEHTSVDVAFAAFLDGSAFAYQSVLAADGSSWGSAGCCHSQMVVKLVGLDGSEEQGWS